jgi:hypothetical protein
MIPPFWDIILLVLNCRDVDLLLNRPTWQPSLVLELFGLLLWPNLVLSSINLSYLTRCAGPYILLHILLVGRVRACELLRHQRMHLLSWSSLRIENNVCFLQMRLVVWSSCIILYSSCPSSARSKNSAISFLGLICRHSIQNVLI